MTLTGTLAGRYLEVLDEVLAALRNAYGNRLVAVAVYGSVGRGTPRPGSDIDLLVVARDLPRGRFARLDEFLPVEDLVAGALRQIDPAAPPPLLSPVFKTPEELALGSPLFLDMVEDARILHDPDRVLTGHLERLRARLAELGARRIWRGEGWYWDLKPDWKPGDVVSL